GGSSNKVLDKIGASRPGTGGGGSGCGCQSSEGAARDRGLIAVWRMLIALRRTRRHAQRSGRAVCPLVATVVLAGCRDDAASTASASGTTRKPLDGRRGHD